MDMTGEERIAAPRDAVWAALNDPEILKQCIPGCQSLEMKSPTELSAVVKLKVGPVSASFAGDVVLSNINAPESYTISGEGKGGIAGFAKGGADVTLTEDGDETILSYEVKAQVGGKIAQLGQRLIDGAAKSTADDFFKRFEAEMQSRYGPPPAAVAAETAEAPAEKAGVMSGLMKKIGLGKKDDAVPPGDAA